MDCFAILLLRVFFLLLLVVFFMYVNVLFVCLYVRGISSGYFRYCFSDCYCCSSCSASWPSSPAPSSLSSSSICYFLFFFALFFLLSCHLHSHHHYCSHHHLYLFLLSLFLLPSPFLSISFVGVTHGPLTQPSACLPPSASNRFVQHKLGKPVAWVVSVPGGAWSVVACVRVSVMAKSKAAEKGNA